VSLATAHQWALDGQLSIATAMCS